jgi:pyruvate,orthophosphate dikinase
MMFNAEHLHCLRGALLLPDAQRRALMVARLQELHHQDSVQLMTAAAGKPLVVRLLDPPLHEFLPATVTSDMHQQWGISPDDLQQCIDGLSETNPMMGHRGCRLFLSHPELYTMQINALCQAVQTVHSQGGTVRLSILIPFIADVVELRMIVDTIRRAMPSSVACSVGTMIETPRACLVAGELAPLVDFFSFGTNDLTQMTWGVSRDDSAWLMDCYPTHGIINPFMSFDRTGVGALMQHACDQGRRANPQIKFSVCGEHAGCPDAIAFFHDIGIHSISCAPNRVMTAIVASAQSGASRNGVV